MSHDAFQSDRCAVLMKALSEPARLRIVDLLRAGPKSVSEIADELELELVNASHHLGVLKHSGIVECRRDGRQMIYNLAEGLLQGKGRDNQQLDFGCCQLVVPLTKK